jgi:hypothetical protein
MDKDADELERDANEQSFYIGDGPTGEEIEFDTPEEMKVVANVQIDVSIMRFRGIYLYRSRIT